ncbi:MAG: hypothetical protein K2X26_05095 [Chitinophagaceae bacterium]|jgi:hypothetical protein|nr:hypothetical protein [Chitinophagaceae bacterium]
MQRVIFSIVLVLTVFSVTAQEKKKKGEFYFSWGYNKEWYTRSSVSVNQPGLGNNYTLKNVIGHDHIGWDEGIFSIPLSIPQYNYRLGYFFNQQKGLAFEINFDHTKFIIQDGQTIRMVGTYNGRGVDSSVLFSKATGSYYYLNNGANFLLFNLVKRWNWAESKNKKVKLDVLAKAGIGPVIPHVENSFFGQANKDGFQFGGWNVGVEGAVKATFFQTVFLEFSNKVDYARYSGLKVYEGKARQAFGCYEMILSLGFTFGGKERK